MKRSPWRRHAGSLPLAGALAARARLTPAGTSAAVVQKLQAEVARTPVLPPAC